MYKDLMLGIDIGTSACKVAMFKRDGTPVATASQSYGIHYPQPGWAQQNPEDWWDGVCQALKDLWQQGKASPESVAGVGIGGQGWAAVAIDKKGHVLCPSPLWMDTRAKDICEELSDAIGRERIFQVSGNPFKPTYTTPKIIWLKRNMPEVYAKTEYILQSNSFIVHRLTGAITQDLSQGYGLHCFDLQKGEYDYVLCEELGIKASLLPELVPCHHIAGAVTMEAAAASGLKEGTPVVAGGLDAACGTLGAGVIRDGETQVQGGQAGGMSIVTSRYNMSPVLINGYHVVPGRWLVQGGTVGGGGVLQWLRREFGKGESFDQLTAGAGDIPPGTEGLVFLPYMAGERSPIWDEDAKGVYYGLDYAKTKAHFIRAAMEGVAFSLRHNLEVAESAGTPAEEMCAMGGAANSPLWMQIKADVTGKPIAVSASDTATTLGAALLAGVAVGLYGNFGEAVSATVSVQRRYEPDESNKQVYDKNYAIYRQLYERLKPISIKEVSL